MLDHTGCTSGAYSEESNHRSLARLAGLRGCIHWVYSRSRNGALSAGIDGDSVYTSRVKSKLVEFRLRDTFLSQLQGHADEAKVSVNDEARRRVIESLREDGRFLEMQTRFESLEGDVRDLKDKLAVAVQALLIATTYQGKKAMTPEDAKKWVDSNLRQ